MSFVFGSLPQHSASVQSVIPEISLSCLVIPAIRLCLCLVPPNTELCLVTPAISFISLLTPQQSTLSLSRYPNNQLCLVTPRPNQLSRSRQQSSSLSRQSTLFRYPNNRSALSLSLPPQSLKLCRRFSKAESDSVVAPAAATTGEEACTAAVHVM